MTKTVKEHVPDELGIHGKDGTIRRTGRGKETHAQVNGMNIQVLPYEDSVKYLGRATSFCDTNDAEITNRTNAAWRKFTVYKKELTNKQTLPLKKQISLIRRSYNTDHVIRQRGLDSDKGSRIQNPERSAENVANDTRCRAETITAATAATTAATTTAQPAAT